MFKIRVCHTSVLHIRKVTGIIYGKFSLFSHLNIHCGSSLETAHLDSSNEGAQHKFSLRNMKNYL